MPVLALYTLLALDPAALVAVTKQLAAAEAVSTPAVIVQLGVEVANETAPEPEPPVALKVADMPTTSAVPGVAATLSAAWLDAALNENVLAAEVAALYEPFAALVALTTQVAATAAVR